MDKKADIQQQLIEKISQQFNIPASQLTANTRFNADLHLNSFRAVELIADIEDHFHIEIPDEKISRIYKIEDLVNAIYEVQNG